MKNTPSRNNEFQNGVFSSSAVLLCLQDFQHVPRRSPAAIAEFLSASFMRVW